MSQLDIFEFIESPQAKEYRLEQEKIQALEAWVDKQDKLIRYIHYGGIGYGDKKYMLELAKTFTYHFANMKKDIYIASFNDGEYYFRVYQVKDRVLIENINAKNITDDIYFPAMCLKMLNTNGYPIHFSNREDFIMNDLGFKNIGVLRSDIFKTRDFCTLKASWQVLTDYLKT